MRVLNATCHKQKLTKGSPLTHYDEPVTLVAPTKVEHPQVQGITPKCEDVIAAARPNLSDAESRELEDLLTKYRHIFAMKSDDYRQTNRVYHCIDMGETQLIHQPPRRHPLSKQAEVGEMLDDMQ
jgi:hypothetical protein